MIRRILALAGVIALAAGAGHTQAVSRNQIQLAADYDLDATSYTYLYSNGIGGAINNGGKPEVRQITTDGSSATVTSLNTDEAFEFVAVGDLLEFTVSGVGYTRKVTARASADSITVNDAVTISADASTGVVFQYRTPAVGTGDVGWVNTQGAPTQFWYNIEQISVTGGIRVKIECRNPSAGNGTVTVYPDASESGSTNDCKSGYLDAANACAVEIAGGPSYGVGFQQCRIGMLIDSADDGTDTGADLEIISAGVSVIR